MKGAARIKVDGRGGLLLYDTQGEGVETIALGALKSLCLQQVRRAYVRSGSTGVGLSRRSAQNLTLPNHAQGQQRAGEQQLRGRLRRFECQIVQPKVRNIPTH